MIRRHNHDLSYLEFPHLSEYAEIRHGIFTRLGGFSKGRYQGLNIGMGNGDSLDHVLQNRAAISNCLEHCELVFANQVHGTTIINISKCNPASVSVQPPPPSGGRLGGGKCCHLPSHRPPPAGRGSERLPADDSIYSDKTKSGDAMITNFPGKYLVIQTADCQAVLIYDPIRRAVANIHSGWRGSILNIIGLTIQTMIKEFDSDPKNLLTGIGPSLGPCCAEFIHYRTEIPKAFWSYKNRKDCFDFWAISKDQLTEAGIPSNHIVSSNLCTRCRTDLFFSYRKERLTGRFATVIGIT